MEKKVISQGSLREFANDGDDQDRYYLPARGLVLSGEFHLIPENTSLINYANQLNEILNRLSLPARNIVLIPDTDYLLDLAILQNLTLLEKEFNLKNINYLVYPYANTKETAAWINLLHNYGINIKPAFPQKKYFDNLKHPSHRGGWGRWVNNPNILSFPEKYSLPYPVSWIGQGLEEILEAYKNVVDKTGNNEVYFKPIFSAGGFTLAHVTNEEELRNHYRKLKEQGALDFDNQEIPVEIQANISDIEGLYSMQYTQQGLLTPSGFSKQIVDINQWQGNIFNEEKADEELLNIWKRFIKGYQEYENSFGWGGLDLAKTKDGWVILEHNGLRITGAHPAIYIAEQLQVENLPFATKKTQGQVNCDLKTMWEILNRESLAFNPLEKTGIFPIVWFPGSGMLWAVGENPIQLIDNAYELLVRNNYITS